MVDNIPKAELHVHIEATLTPKRAIELAKKNGVELDHSLFDENLEFYIWEDDGTAMGNLTAFVHTYDKATSVLKTAEDYFDITYDYLKSSAAQNSIYVEFLVFADPEPIVGITYKEMIDGIAKGIDKAQSEFGIEARILPTFVRHFGKEQALKDAEKVVSYPHKYVTGLNLAGDENAGTISDFKPAYDLADPDNKLGRTAHAGEASGPQSVLDACEILEVTRIGHMVRVIEDKDIMLKVLKSGVTPEICISSNIELKVYDKIEDHPVRELFDAGFPVTLATDDPVFFKCDLTKEFQIAKDNFNFSDTELLQITKNAINSAFIDDKTRQKLLAKVKL